MVKNIAPATISIVLMGFLCACASTSVNERSIRMEISSAKRMIQANRDKIVKLKDKKIGDRGFFYVIDNNGIVVFHPQELLIGRNFSSYWFIKAILKNRSGCLSYTIGAQEHFIFFDTLNRDQILCFSVSAADLEGPVDKCVRVNPEDFKTVEGSENQSEPVVESQNQGTTDGSSEGK